MYSQKFTKTAGVSAPGPSALGSSNNPRVNGSNQYQRQQQQQQQPFPNGSGAGCGNGSNGPIKSPPPAELQRRASLVKPTWASISPGQVPSTTFDELVNSANNAGLALQDDGGANGSGSAVADGDTQSELGMLSNKLLNKNGLSQRQKKREVELYDIFGKVGGISVAVLLNTANLITRLKGILHDGGAGNLWNARTGAEHQVGHCRKVHSQNRARLLFRSKWGAGIGSSSYTHIVREEWDLQPDD